MYICETARSCKSPTLGRRDWFAPLRPPLHLPPPEPQTLNMYARGRRVNSPSQFTHKSVNLLFTHEAVNLQSQFTRKPVNLLL